MHCPRRKCGARLSEPCSLLIQDFYDQALLVKVWEVDKKLLQQHALPTVEAYGYTTETLLRALDMDEFLPGPVGAPAKLLGGPRVSRRAIRAGRC